MFLSVQLYTVCIIGAIQQNTQFRCLCPKTVEFFIIVTSGSNTHTDIIL